MNDDAIRNIFDLIDIWKKKRKKEDFEFVNFAKITIVYSRIFFPMPTQVKNFGLNRYNFCSDELFRIRSKKISILSGVL